MTSEEKWRTVGRRDQKKGRSTHGGSEIANNRGHSVTGLQVSENAFSQFSDLKESRKTSHRTLSEDASSHKTSHRTLSEDASSRPEPNRKKSRRAKLAEKPKSFEESARELEYTSVQSYLEEVQSKALGNEQNWLKEVIGFLQLFFSEVEPEKDVVFSDKTPGYPASELQADTRDLLLRHIGMCTQLALEGALRHCVDSLLAEVRNKTSSYGTRVMAQLLIQSCPSICTEASERISLLLGSRLNRVPEALSLLWVGLPRPQTHPEASLQAWYKLCLPLLHSLPNVPKQVVNYSLDYTALLLWHVDDGGQLSRVLSPKVLPDLLTGTQFTQREAQKNIKDICRLLQLRLLVDGDMCTEYFLHGLRYLDHCSSHELLLEFLRACLCKESRCLSLWLRLLPSHPHPSSLLLSYLHTHWDQHLSTIEMRDFLGAVCGRGTSEQIEVAKAILVNVDLKSSVQSRKQGWCTSLCCLVVAGITVAYLLFLGTVLISVAREGPQQHIDLLQSIVPRELTVKKLVGWLWSWLSLITDFFYRV